MNDAIWFALSTIAILGAYHQIAAAWFAYQVRKRRREETLERLDRLTATRES